MFTSCCSLIEPNAAVMKICLSEDEIRRWRDCVFVCVVVCLVRVSSLGRPGNQHNNTSLSNLGSPLELFLGTTISPKRRGSKVLAGTARSSKSRSRSGDHPTAFALRRSEGQSPASYVVPSLSISPSVCSTDPSVTLFRYVTGLSIAPSAPRKRTVAPRIPSYRRIDYNRRLITILSSGPIPSTQSSPSIGDGLCRPRAQLRQPGLVRPSRI